MTQDRSPARIIGWLGLMFFLIGMAPGFFVPTLTNILKSKGYSELWITWVWMALPVASMMSPVCVGALADNRFAAEKILGWIGIAGSVLLAAAFVVLDLGGPPWLFVVLMFVSTITVAPTWSMVASISMTHLKDGDREFPIVRLGGTFGWMGAGFILSLLLKADSSPVAGYAAAIARLAAGLVAFRLPHTPPQGNSRSIRSLIGVDAFRLLKERDHFVFFLTTMLLSMPLVAFYMWTPRHLESAGDQHAAATMAIGQFSEIIAMLLMVMLLTRFRVKTLLLVALGLSALRYGLFAWSGVSGERTGLIIGVALHGLCYTLYFITAQMFIDRRVPVSMRSQTQGLLSMASNGVGSILGTMMVAGLYQVVVANGSGGWTSYWAILGTFILLITIGFAIAYKGMPATRDQT